MLKILENPVLSCLSTTLHIRLFYVEKTGTSESLVNFLTLCLEIQILFVVVQIWVLVGESLRNQICFGKIISRGTEIEDHMIRIISTFHVIILHIVIISNTVSIMDISKFRRDHVWIVCSRLWSRGNSTSLGFPLVSLLTFSNRLIFCGFMWPVTCVTGWKGGLSLISTSDSTWEKYSIRGGATPIPFPWIWKLFFVFYFF